MTRRRSTVYQGHALRGTWKWQDAPYWRYHEWRGVCHCGVAFTARTKGGVRNAHAAHRLAIR